jgi:hypothetical protein
LDLTERQGYTVNEIFNNELPGFHIFFRDSRSPVVYPLDTKQRAAPTGKLGQARVSEK